MSYYRRQYFGTPMGIEAVSKKGAFGEGKLAHDWVEVVDRLLSGSRLTQARAVARAREVQTIGIMPGRISAFVADYAQGHHVDIKLPVSAPEYWDDLLARIAARPLLAAQIENGELPQEVLELGLAANVPLLPTGFHELTLTCDCYDWSVPCKHSAAVYFLIGEELDRDPLLLLTLRGLARGDLLGRLTGLPIAAPNTATTKAVPLPASVAAFWDFTPPDLPTIPEGPEAPVFPNYFPFWTGTRPVQDVLGEYYPKAAKIGQDLLRDAGD